MATRRQRDLIERVRYPNPLPELQYAPRLAKVPPPVQNFLSPVFARRIAEAQQFPMTVDAEGGMPLDLARIESLWQGDAHVPAGTEPAELDPEDEFLLSDALLQEEVADEAAPQSTAAQAASVTWLRRTEYLGAEQRRKRAAEPKVAAKELDTSAPAQIARIEQGFDAANVPLESLRHPSKPGVHAVDAYAVLPDPETWATQVQVVRFVDFPGRSAADVRAETAVLRPVTDSVSGQQRMSLYLTAADTLPQYGAEDEPEPAPAAEKELREDIASLRYQKRRRLGRFPRVPWVPEQHGASADDANVYATPMRHVRDLEPTDQLSSATNQLLVVLDDGVPDAAPALSSISTGATVAENAAAAADDDLFGGVQPEADTDSTLPPQAAAERARRLVPRAAPKAAYYHRIDMRYTLRLRRQRKAEQQLMLPYPDFWHRISLGNRELTENELARRILERAQVDQLDTAGVEYESSDDDDEADAEGDEEEAEGDEEAEGEAEGDGEAQGEAEGEAEEAGKEPDQEAKEADEEAREAGKEPDEEAEEAGKEPDGEAGKADEEAKEADEEPQGDAEGEADTSDSDSSPDAASAEYDDELAALRAEAADAGDTPVEGRRRR